MSMSEEARMKMSMTLKERWSDPKYREKMANAMAPVYKDPEYKKKRSDIAKKMWSSPEHCKNMSEQRTARAKEQWADSKHREKMTEVTKSKWEDPLYREERTGENNGNWKGGIACESYCKDWTFPEFKEIIKERDGYKCQNPDCWGKSKRLDVHHINYIKKDCHPLNLITLCASCNSRANGSKEKPRDYWQELYTNIQNMTCDKGGLNRNTE